MYMDSTPTDSIRTTTDREGKFEVSGLQPVIYQVFAFLQGYAPLLRNLDDTQTSLYRVGDSVTLVLTKGGVITGAVTSPVLGPTPAPFTGVLTITTPMTGAINGGNPLFRG